MQQERFRQTFDYSEAHGFSGGFPNFHQQDYGDGVVYGAILLNSATWKDVPAIDLGHPPEHDIGARFRATNNYALRTGFRAGFPNFHKADYGDGLVYGTLLLSSNDAEEPKDVLASDLGIPSSGDVGERFRAANNYAHENGFIAGFPNFHQADYGNGLVYGIILIKAGAIDKDEPRNVPLDIMNMYSWPFDAGITREQRLRTLERHNFAYTRINACANLSSDERSDLISAYRRTITHGINTDPTANASATVNGSQIDINFGNLFPLGNREIAQSLIHEMMHCAGYTHPTRINSPSPSPDIPGDGGPYYGTPPLQAELCIAGVQSLVLENAGSLCEELNGKFSIKRNKAVECNEKSITNKVRL